METKKNANANLERKRFIYFEIGLITALALLFFAFEWSTAKVELDMPLTNSIDPMEVDIIPITRMKKEKIEQPKPKAPPVQKQTELEIIDDSKTADSNVDAFTSDASSYTITPFIEDDKGDDIIDAPEEVFDPFLLSEKPEFPGGETALFRYITENMVYPSEALEYDIQGRVFIQFVVNKKGKVTDVQIARSSHPLLDEEAKRIVESMPKWSAGEQMGKKVSSRFILPINFKIGK